MNRLLRKKVMVLLSLLCAMLLASCQTPPSATMKATPSASLASSVSPTSSTEGTNGTSAPTSNAGDSQHIKLEVKGKMSQVNIDADVVLPSTEAYPVIKTAPFVYDKSRLLNAWFGEGSENMELQPADPALAGKDNGAYGRDIFVYEKDNKRLWLNIPASEISLTTESGITIDLSKDNRVDSGVADKCKISPDQAVETAIAFLKKLGIEDIVVCQMDAYGKLPDYDYGLYSIYFNHCIGGIPVTLERMLFNNSMEKVLVGDLIQVVVSDDGIVLCNATSMRQYESTIQDNSECLSIEEAVAIFQNNINQFIVNTSDGIPVVTRISLEYLPSFESGEDWNANILRPAWHFSTGMNIQTNNNLNVYIDAITGEITIQIASK